MSLKHSWNLPVESFSSEKILTGKLSSLKYPKSYPGRKCYYLNLIQYNPLDTRQTDTEIIILISQ